VPFNNSYCAQYISGYVELFILSCHYQVTILYGCLLNPESKRSVRGNQALHALDSEKHVKDLKDSSEFLKTLEKISAKRVWSICKTLDCSNFVSLSFNNTYCAQYISVFVKLFILSCHYHVTIFYGRLLNPESKRSVRGNQALRALDSEKHVKDLKDSSEFLKTLEKISAKRVWSIYKTLDCSNFVSFNNVYNAQYISGFVKLFILSCHYHVTIIYGRLLNPKRRSVNGNQALCALDSEKHAKDSIDSSEFLKTLEKISAKRVWSICKTIDCSNFVSFNTTYCAQNILGFVKLFILSFHYHVTIYYLWSSS
jgi:hypothetical protein